MNAKLAKCETFGQMLDIWTEYYDVDGAKVGSITRGVLVAKFPDILILTKTKPHPEHA